VAAVMLVMPPMSKGVETSTRSAPTKWCQNYSASAGRNPMARLIRAAKWFVHRIKTRCSAIEISVVVARQGMRT
jgi:hypothetical protein